MLDVLVRLCTPLRDIDCDGPALGMGFRLSVKANCADEAHSMHPHLHAKDGSHHYCFDGEVSSCSVYPYYSHRPLHAGDLFVMEIVVNAANFTEVLL